MQIFRGRGKRESSVYALALLQVYGSTSQSRTENTCILISLIFVFGEVTYINCRPTGIILFLQEKEYILKKSKSLINVFYRSFNIYKQNKIEHATNWLEKVDKNYQINCFSKLLCCLVPMIRQ